MDKAYLNSFFRNLTTVVPKYKEIPEFFPDGSYSGIKAITFDGLNIGDKKTKVFAYLGFPKDLKKGEKRKAIVLVHGGGGHAFLTWVKKWNDLGYIAIAMNTVGGFPLLKNAWRAEALSESEYTNDLQGVFYEDGYTVVPMDYMSTPNAPLDNQAFYHAVASVILSTNILFSISEVDKTKVGITGISWGGVLTSTVLGYDDRFAFAIPIYGSAYLTESYSKMWKDVYAHENNKKLWSIENNLPNGKTAILWLCWNDDCCFSINSNSKSYLLTAKCNEKTLLSMVDKMDHSHVAGWARQESYAYAESITSGGFALTKIDGEYSDKHINLRLTVDERVDKTKIKARLFYIDSKPTFSVHLKQGRVDPLDFMDQEWQTADLYCDGDIVSGEAPKEAFAYYVEVCTEHNGNDYITTTPAVNF